MRKPQEGREEGAWGGVPYERMIAVLRYRGLDAEAVRVAQERQLATLRETAELMSRTMQEIGSRQAALMRDTVERMVGSIPGATGDASLADLTRRQMEASREQVEAQLAAFRAIADLMWDCGRNAFDLLNRTMAEQVGAITDGDAGQPGEATPPASTTPKRR